VFEGQTADEGWQKIASALHTGVDTMTQASRNGQTRELLHAAISISDPRQRWVVTREPPINVAFALAEIIWIMAGRNDSRFLNYFNRELPKYAGYGATYPGAYGCRLRKHLGGDQLDRAYQTLSKNPESRQVVLQIWDANVDLPKDDGKPRSEDIPCNIVAMLKVRDGALEWTQIMRSNDIFRGLPYNFVQFTAMQEIMAGWLGLNVGTYNHFSDSLHIYERDLGCIEAVQPVKIDKNTDLLVLPRAEFDLVFADLECQANMVTDERVRSNSLLKGVEKCTLPAPYRNILCVLYAEAARRQEDCEVANEIMASCTNPSYQQLYARWLARFRVHEAV